MKIKIKKRVILRLLEKHGAVPLETAAKELYGKGDEMAQIKVIRALNAYRVKDTVFQNIRVRQKKIVRI